MQHRRAASIRNRISSTQWKINEFILAISTFPILTRHDATPDVRVYYIHIRRLPWASVCSCGHDRNYKHMPMCI